MALHAPPYLLNGIELRVARWQSYDLVAPLMNGVIYLVLGLWAVLPTEEQQLMACGSGWDGYTAVLEPADEVRLLGGCGRASTLLCQLAVVRCIVKHQYRGFWQ